MISQTHEQERKPEKQYVIILLSSPKNVNDISFYYGILTCIFNLKNKLIYKLHDALWD